MNKADIYRTYSLPKLNVTQLDYDSILDGLRAKVNALVLSVLNKAFMGEL